MPGEEFKLKFKTEGAEQSAKDADKVSDAQAKIGETVGKTSKQIDETVKSQDKLNASGGDYISLLSQLNPTLGAYADALVKGGAVAADFSSQQINLGDAIDTVSTAMAANAKTLKLLGAASVAGLGFLALAKGISTVIEQAQALQKELDALEGRATTNEEAIIAGQAGVVRASRQRREGAFSASEQASSDQAFGTAVRAGAIPDDLIAAFQENLAALIGKIQPRDIERLTLAGFRSDPSAPENIRGLRATAALGRDSTTELADRERERARQEGSRRARSTLDEIRSADPTLGKANLNKFIDGAGIQFEDKDDRKGFEDLLRRAVKSLDVVKQIEAVRQAGGDVEAAQDLANFDVSRNTLRKGTVRAAVGDASLERATFIGAFGAADSTFKQDAATKLLEAILQLERTVKESAGPGTTINNSRVMFPDVASQRRAISNGQSRARDREL